MNTPKELRYAKSHEWIIIDEDGMAKVGITDFAQEQMGDLTYVELPDVDDHFEAGDEVAVIESVKAASDIYAPVSGTVTHVNEQLTDAPELINSDPYGDGWIFRIRPDDLTEIDALMTADEYEDSAVNDNE
ncbi:MAG: glycine cleavage system protein GcvH [Spartobacteria bacterium]|nr:glycine cleavage system protein GcvH [Spartobacteria bacterium]